jgi:hypothetical protein
VNYPYDIKTFRQYLTFLLIEVTYYTRVWEYLPERVRQRLVAERWPSA